MTVIWVKQHLEGIFRSVPTYVPSYYIERPKEQFSC